MSKQNDMQEQPKNNRLWFLMSRSLSGESSPEETLELQQLLQQDSSLSQQFELLNRMWHAGEKNHSENIDEEERRHISRILQLAKIETANTENNLRIQPRHNRHLLYAISVAAAVVLIAISVISFYEKGNANISTTNNTQTLVADKGTKTRTILPDGSTVWVNAGSHISYSKDFSGKTREVTLDGEAYFDVVKQPQRPFIVHVSGYDIRVLGTAFNVKSYPEDKTVETTLLRGLVQVTKQGTQQQKPIMLHPNEKLILNKVAANTTEKLPVNAEDIPQKKIAFTIKRLDSSVLESERIETAWVYNRLEFRGDSFEEIAGKLDRWYNVEIYFDDDDVKQLHFTGSFENETVQQALEALKTASVFGYTINGNEIHIKSIR